MKLSFTAALNIIDDAHAVRVDDNELLYPMVDLEEGSIRIDSEHGNPIYITAAGNDTVEVDDTTTTLSFVDEDGQTVTLMPLIVGRSLIAVYAGLK